MRRWLIISLLVAMAMSFCAGNALATIGGTAGSNVIAANEYISIIVNGGKENTGRFSINTTGGDPDRSGDENKPLVYGMADPWTSYTTIQVDGNNYVFGGRTQTSAGRQGPFGRLVSGPAIVEGNAIRTVYQLGFVEVEQMLSFTRSSTTGLKDTARIAYRLTNQDTAPHSVGMRLMLDTMLGANDGAPFRVKEQAVTTDALFTKAEIPDFWQAFDSLAEPEVMSQGTLRGSGVTTPDRVYFTNWGVLAESIWDFDFEIDRIFLRKGEFELDSAIAMFWDPVPLPAGESVTWVTYYGLGGITIAPGKISLGVTSPAIVTESPDGRTRFPVVAYVENSGEGEARDVKASIQLPEGLILAPGQQAIGQLGNLDVGQSVQIAWQVEVKERVRGTLNYQVRVEAANSEPNQVRRQVQILHPARLEVELSGPPRLLIEDGSLQPVPFAVRAAITNVGEMEAKWVQAQWEAPIGLRLAPGESRIKLSGDLAPGEKRLLQWFITPTDVASDNLPYSVKVESGVTDTQVLNGFISIPQLPQLVRLAAEEPKAAITLGSPYKVAVKGYNLRNIQEAEFLLQYPVNLLRVTGGKLGIEPGQVLASISATTGQRIPMEVELEPLQGMIRLKITQLPEVGTRRLTGNLCAIRFLAVDEGSGVIQLHSARLTTSGGQVVELGAAGLPVTVSK